MSLFQGLPPKENESNNVVGKSEKSWLKHEIIEKSAKAFIAVGALSKKGRGIIIDMHAGDAEGVPHPQGDFFCVNKSTTTPAISERLSSQYPIDVLLCEKNKACRLTLIDRFSAFSVIGDHEGAFDFISNLKKHPFWGLCIADPNGHGKIGMQHMCRLSKLIPRLDFMIIFPQKGLTDCIAVRNNEKNIGSCVPIVKNAIASANENEWMLSEKLDRYGDRIPSLEFPLRLNRKKMATTNVIYASGRFHYRIIIISNYLPDGIIRDPLFQVLK